MLPPAYLAKKLAQPLPTKDGGVLRTIADASGYMLAPPHEHAEFRTRWRRAVELILQQAAVAAASRPAHLALFCDVKLDINATDV